MYIFKKFKKKKFHIIKINNLIKLLKKVYEKNMV